MTLQDHATSSVNGTGTNRKIDTPLTQPRSPSDLHAFLHGYCIKSGKNTYETARAAIVMGAIEAGHWTAFARRAARELAGLDPALSWLPTWKPRVLAKGAE